MVINNISAQDDGCCFDENVCPITVEVTDEDSCSAPSRWQYIPYTTNPNEFCPEEAENLTWNNCPLCCRCSQDQVECEPKFQAVENSCSELGEGWDVYTMDSKPTPEYCESQMEYCCNCVGREDLPPNCTLMESSEQECAYTVLKKEDIPKICKPQPLACCIDKTNFDFYEPTVEEINKKECQQTGYEFVSGEPQLETCESYTQGLKKDAPKFCCVCHCDGTGTCDEVKNTNTCKNYEEFITGEAAKEKFLQDCEKEKKVCFVCGTDNKTGLPAPSWGSPIVNDTGSTLTCECGETVARLISEKEVEAATRDCLLAEGEAKEGPAGEEEIEEPPTRQGLVPIPTGSCPKPYQCAATEENAGYCVTEGGANTGIACNYTLCDFIQIFINASKIILSMMGAVALVLFIWGGQGLILSAGNPEKIKEAKNLLLGTVFGIIVILAAWQLINLGLAAMILEPGEFNAGEAVQVFGQPWSELTELCKKK